MPVTTEQIGPVYDLLLATRDGSTLPCKNLNGQTVNLSQVAFMTTIARDKVQHEETELQHKDQLVQLGSSNLIDREFDQWPQVTQGDWAGGIYQRVFSGPNSDPTRYWDGTGILWPLTDTVPQQPLALPPTVDTNHVVEYPLDPAFGRVSGSPAIVVIQHDVTATKWFLISYFDNGSRTALDITAQTPGTGWLALFVFNDLIYLIAQDTNSKLYWSNSASMNLLATFTGYASVGITAAANVGNHAYIAVGLPFVSTGVGQRIRLFDITNTNDYHAPLASSFIDLTFDGSVSVSDFIFHSGDLLIVVTDGTNSSIVRYSLSSAIFSQVADLPGAAACTLGSVAGSVFVVASNIAITFPVIPGSLDMYLLQGGSLQHIGPLQTQLNNNSTSLFVSFSQITSFGSYAIFSVLTVDTTTSSFAMAVLAYDVVRGRLFKVATPFYIQPDAGFVPRAPTMRLVVDFPRQYLSASRIASWELVYNPGSSEKNPVASLPTMQELLFGPESGSAIVRQGVVLTSSLIDFTSSQPKLYRQVLATFSPLAANPGISVKLDVWIDQDPASLSATPNFTKSIDGASNAGVSSLSLSINVIATKLVYRVTTTGGNVAGGGNVLVGAPGLVSVIVRAASGWVQNLMLDLAPNLITNGKNADCWSNQGIDHVAAYNFLRQLWRLGGGQVTATFPNGDSGPWLVQDMHFDSPKPFGVSFRADQRSGLQYVATLKIREDVD